MNCPKCDGAMYDNRADKASGKRKASTPDFKCRDRECDGVIWPPKGGAASSAGSGSATATAAGTRALGGVFAESIDYSKAMLTHFFTEENLSIELIMATATTLFQSAASTGQPIRPPKFVAPPPAPAPPPPPPPPAPTPAPVMTDPYGF